MTTHRAWAIQVGTDDEGRALYWTNDTSTMESRCLGDAYDCGDSETACEMAGGLDGSPVPLLIHRADEDVVTEDQADAIYRRVSRTRPRDQAAALRAEINALIREGGE